MDPVTISGIAQGAGNALSAYIAGEQASSAQEAANRANQYTNWENREWAGRENATNRQWQQMMSSTSWQRGVADMKAAGINPLLAVSRGGASTPGGSSISGTSSATSAAVPRKGISDALSSASSAVDLALQRQKQIADIALTNNTAKKISVDTDNAAVHQPFKKAVNEVEQKVSDFAHSLFGSSAQSSRSWLDKFHDYAVKYRDHPDQFSD